MPLFSYRGGPTVKDVLASIFLPTFFEDLLAPHHTAERIGADSATTARVAFTITTNESDFCTNV